MANRKGRAKAQDIYEMISDMTETKPCDIGAENSHGDRLREILDGTLDDVAGMAKGERVSLEDVEAVKEQTLVYLRACKETLTFPTSLGLARSLGYLTVHCATGEMHGQIPQLVDGWKCSMIPVRILSGR